jgi:hypothetical protein
MPPVPVKYPLDPTGLSPDNLVRDEPKTLGARKVRVFVMDNGAFYSESMLVRDTASNRVLIRGVDYYPTQLYELPTLRYGKEICSVVVITDQTCSANIEVTAQMLGGEFSYSYDAIIQLVNALQLDSRPLAWGNILNKPEAFPAAPHMHDVGDTFGWEYMVSALQRLRQSVEIGSAGGENKIYRYVDSVAEILQAAIDATDAGVSYQEVLAALGYRPLNPAGDTMTGLLKLNGGVTLASSFKEKVITISATTPSTVIDLSQGGIFVVNLHANTGISFNIGNVSGLQPNEALSFTLILVNSAQGGNAISFINPVSWSGGLIPPRTLAANGRDEFYFSTFNSGASYTGSLSNEDVK